MRLRLIPIAAGAFLLAACGTHHAATPPPTTSTTSAAAGLTARAAASVGGGFTGAYALTSPAGAGLATVRVYVTSAAYRVDVVEKTATTSLYGGTGRGTVACTIAPGIPTVCYAVAKPDAAVPARFDVGVERVFRDDLPVMASGDKTLTIATAPLLSTLTSPAPGTQCYAVTSASPGPSPGFDAGTYCLTPTGLLVGFRSTSGDLTLTAHGGAPTTKQLTAPAKAQPLPSATSS